MPLAPESQYQYNAPFWATFSHPITSNRMFGVVGFTSGSATGITMVADPGSSSRLVGRLRASANAAEAVDYFPFSYAASNGTSLTTSFDDYIVETRIRNEWQGANTAATDIHRTIAFWSDDPNGTGVRIASVAFANGGRIRVDTDDTTNTSTAGAEVTEDTWTVVTAHYQKSSGASDGKVFVYVNGVLKLTHTHNSTNEPQGYGMESSSFGMGTNNVETYVDYVVGMRESYRSEFSLTIGSLFIDKAGHGRLLDVSQTAIGVGVIFHPSVYDDAWRTSDDVKCRLEWIAGTYDDGDFPSTGTTIETEFSLAAAAEFHSASTVTGLTAGTAYSVRPLFHSTTVGTGDTYTGPVMNFRTLPAVATRLKFAQLFCWQHERYGQKLARYVSAEPGLLFKVHQGDDFYNDQGGANDPMGDTSPNPTRVAWCRDWGKKHQCSEARALMDRSCATFIQDDDHDACENNWSMGYVKGFVTNANPAGTDGAARASLCQDSVLNAAAVSRGNLYDRLQEGYYDSARKAHLGAGNVSANWHEQSEYRHQDTGASRMVFLDSRRYQNSAGTGPFAYYDTVTANPTMLGGDQLDWLLDLIKRCDKPNFLMFTPANPSDVHDQSSLDDNWLQVAPAEWHRIEQALMDNPCIKRVYLFSGDRHASALEERRGQGHYGGRPHEFTKLVAHIRCGPAGAGALPAHYATTQPALGVHYADTPGATATGRPSRGFGIITLHEDTGVCEVEVRSGDDNSVLKRHIFRPLAAA